MVLKLGPHHPETPHPTPSLRNGFTARAVAAAVVTDGRRRCRRGGVEHGLARGIGPGETKRGGLGLGGRGD